MNRRGVLGAVGGCIAALGGCLSSREVPTTNAGSSTPVATTDSTAAGTPTTAPSGETATASAADVRVTYERRSPGPRRERLVVAPDGTLSYRLTCGDATLERSDALGEDAHRSFRRLVVSADVFALADSYECESDCPTDLPVDRYRFVVDGRTTTVSVQAGAGDVPPELRRIGDRLTAFVDRFGPPTCADARK